MNTTTISHRLQSLIVTTLFGVVSSGLASLPAAAAAYEPPTVTVKFADLDVSHPQGATALYHRIRAAAESVCSPFEQIPGLQGKTQLDACIDKAVADAVFKVNVPALTAVYSSKTGKTAPLRVVASVQTP